MGTPPPTLERGVGVPATARSVSFRHAIARIIYKPEVQRRMSLLSPAQSTGLQRDRVRVGDASETMARTAREI